jgi:hypothetical protein
MARRDRQDRIHHRKVHQAARRRRRLSGGNRKHRRGRQASYRHGLKDAIAKEYPRQFFSRFPVVAGVKWSPLRLFWMAILMVWSTEQTLQASFEATRQVLRSVFPKWALGNSYTG